MLIAGRCDSLEHSCIKGTACDLDFASTTTTFQPPSKVDNDNRVLPFLRHPNQRHRLTQGAQPRLSQRSSRYRITTPT